MWLSRMWTFMHYSKSNVVKWNIPRGREALLQHALAPPEKHGARILSDAHVLGVLELRIQIWLMYALMGVEWHSAVAHTPRVSLLEFNCLFWECTRWCHETPPQVFEQKYYYGWNENNIAWVSLVMILQKRKGLPINAWLSRTRKRIT